MKDANFVGQDFRYNAKQIIAKRSDLAQFMGGRMKKSASGQTNAYEAGTVLGLASSGADQGFYKPYNSANSDGSQVPVGILAERCETDEFGTESEISILVSGTLYKDLLIGLDSGAISALGGTAYTEHGSNLFRF